jgi:hypothetical protein
MKIQTLYKHISLVNKTKLVKKLAVIIENPNFQPS